MTGREGEEREEESQFVSDGFTHSWRGRLDSPEGREESRRNLRGGEGEDDEGEGRKR